MTAGWELEGLTIIHVNCQWKRVLVIRIRQGHLRRAPLQHTPYHACKCKKSIKKMNRISVSIEGFTLK